MRSLIPLLATLPLLLALPAKTAPDMPSHEPAVKTVVGRIDKSRLEAIVHGLAAFPTRHTLSGANGVDAAATWLEGEFDKIATESGGRLQIVKQTWTEPAGNRIPAPAELTNVLATLPGTASPERVIVISGHYDSRVTDVLDAKSVAPGANDDASGVAVVLEVARAMALSKVRFPATVIFAAVTGEEQGLYGSAYLAKSLKAQNKNVIAMFTNDIVGNSRGEDGKKDDRRVRVFSAGFDPGAEPASLARQRAAGTDADSPARTLARSVKITASRYVEGFGVELVYRNDRYGRGGDHTPFLQNGYPSAVRLTEPNEDWRHQHQDLRTENGVQYGDLPEFVDYAYLRRVAQVNAAIVAELATAPTAPVNVRLRGDLSAKTTLTWDAVTDPIAGYEVLTRRTTAPVWEKTVRLPATEARTVLPYSKDDYLFAVCAVGKTGARSLPTIPLAGPARP
ncbi:MAG: M20/M25/M40 family metallo-hydrolase [Akkermansiaceae bacterium]|nr:M20/M25/M40 family metallo-hydrolase [Armatimonadota bacterium]